MAKKTEHELRCRCSGRVLLAIWGRDSDGRGYLHIKARKNGRVITNTLHKGGEHSLWCTHCGRVTRIYLTPRGSKILPPSTAIPDQLLDDEFVALPATADEK